MMGDLRGLDFLIETLQSTHPGFRRMATTGLGQVGDPRAVQPLIDALDDEHEYVREHAGEALEKIGDPKGLAAVREHREAQEQTPPE